MFVITLKPFLPVARNNVTENAVSVFLAVLIGVLGALLLSNEFYRDLATFIFCFVIASCQYSLLKVGVSVFRRMIYLSI